MVMRTIVKIDEELWMAVAVYQPLRRRGFNTERGKAKVIREELCDGAGVCLGLPYRGIVSGSSRSS